MKVSRHWLQKYFDATLPGAEELADALTFHVAEIEEMEKHGDDDVLDVKILPDRAAYLLSHRGIAKELSAILALPMKSDPLRESLPAYPTTDELAVSIEDAQKCRRYMGALMRGVTVGPSPTWLKGALEAVGQRSINNVVDATNYVMFNLGQPLHAFDAAKLVQKDGRFAIAVRGAHEGEKITTLTGEEFEVPEDTLLITDANADAGVGIAGVKGGKAAGITEATTDIIIESANFDGGSVRRTSQALKLWTDASQRFQNKISPELAAYGMRDVIALIQEIASGELIGVADAYSSPDMRGDVSVSVGQVNGLLGTSYSEHDIASVFDRLGFTYKNESGIVTVTPPFERRDLVITEDLIEEVGRIEGYDKIAPEQLPALPDAPDQMRFRGIERIKDFLIERGFTELSTQTFAAAGAITLANPLDQTKPALRTTLVENMRDALTRAVTVAPRVLGPAPDVKLFEIGTVFTSDGERLTVTVGRRLLSNKKPSVIIENADPLGALFAAAVNYDGEIMEAYLSDADILSLGKDYEPKQVTLGPFRLFSAYPFALRDVAVWTPEGTEQSEVENLIVHEAGDLLARIDLFDRFEKKGDEGVRISYAFRLVFESNERTLSDEDLNPIMERVTNSLNAKEGWEVR